MASTAAALKAQFDFQTRLFNNVLNGVTDEESNERQSDNTNSMKWIAGHMLNSRINTMNQLTGGTPDTTYAAQFGRGVTFDPNATYPAIEEVISHWNSASPAISERLAHMPEEVLESKAPAQSPIAEIDESFRALIAFIISHEALHIGQLSILRKMAGQEAMSFR
jgi:uncharacterized damage-inducible protein DinB